MNLLSIIRVKSILIVAAVMFVTGLFSNGVRAQQPTQSPVRIPSEDDKRDPATHSIREMVVKQQISRRKKEHDEMLKQGDEALKLSEELESSFETNENFTAQDLQKLQELEKIVSKIRNDLGGDDAKDDKSAANSEENSARKSIGAAFKFLRSSTIKLVDELKRSTRFSISVAAIEASNSIIKFARFLRLKK